MRALTMALLAALPVLPATAADTPPIAAGATRLELSATGEVLRRPDTAIISAGVVTTGATAARALDENTRKMAATIAALARAGVADRDMQTNAIRLQPQYRYAENQPPALTGYQATNQVTVRLRDVAGAGGVLDALVAAGANQIDGPTLTIDKPEAALDEARTAALGI
ncbi:SIMPL domain-containing protein, partial [Sphingomonas bacterium]|uniref:SIMPL domain-containing protein n=1 Tax=Sphingomonas bacterium TaxID=1895847 RepID=UPI0015758DFD